MFKNPPKISQIYNDITKKSAILDISEYGRITLTGTDALDLINRLTTNQLEHLEINSGCFTVLTSNKGRIKDLLYLFRQDEKKLLLITSPGNQTNVAEWIDFYTFSEDVEINEISAETKFISIVGPKCEMASKEFSADREKEKFTVFNSSIFGLPCTNFLIPNDHNSDLPQSATKLPDNSLLELIRLERFVPLMNKDFGEHNNPLEAGLKNYISFSKGCYIGQEVIARLDAYNKVQKLLVGLKWDEEIQMETGSSISCDGIDIGNITSSLTFKSGGIGMGYIKKSYATPNSVLLGTNSTGISTKIKISYIPDL